jgi:hypothetical protein
MELNRTIVLLGVLFIPGLAAAWLYRRYGSRRDMSEPAFFLCSFVFGVFAYALTGAVYSVCNESLLALELLSEEPDVVLLGGIWVDIIVATVFALLLSIGALYVDNKKLAARLLQKIGATNRYGDEDVWDYTFNSRQPFVQYVQVRDHARGIVFSGWVDAFSETEKVRELVLRDAQLHDFDGKLVYEMPYIYLARPETDMHIDFPHGRKATEEGR